MEKFKWNLGNKQLPSNVVRLPLQPYVEPVYACDLCRDGRYVCYNEQGDPVPPIGFGDGLRVSPCPLCNSPEKNAIRRCAKVGGLRVENPSAPTLEGFDPHDDAATAMLNAAYDFADNPSGWLTLHGVGKGRAERGAGHWGAGKSHLGEAITRALWSKRVPALCISADRLMNHLGAGWRDEGDDVDYERRLEWVLSLPVLVLDEVNKESPSPSTERMRLHVLDTRYRQVVRGEGGATVLLSNDHPDFWQDPAIADRAMDTRFVQVQVTPVSYRRVQR